MNIRLALTIGMEYFWFLLLGFGLVVIVYLLVMFYMRRQHGAQPGYSGLMIIAVSTACTFAVAYFLLRLGVDLGRGQSRDIVWIALGILWLGLSCGIAYQRQSSGRVLMDLGPSPMSRLQMGIAVVMVAVAIAAFYRESRDEAFGFAAWSVWFFVMARERFQIRDRGITSGGDVVPWKRIIRCVQTADNMVRLDLSRGLRRTIDLKLPADRRDDFIQLVSRRTAEPCSG